MADENFELSRRKALAGLGTIGVASAGAGLGTSAFFSDTETFKGNSLTAGELDLLVDFQEHYSDWSDDEEAAVDAGSVQMPSGGNYTIDPGSVMDGYVGLPTAEEPVIAIPDEDVPDFMNATAIDAFPDNDNGGDGDGIQDPIPVDDECGTLRQEGYLRVNGEWVSALDSPARTAAYQGRPLVELGDVKPGDFGEVTFSLHLCDNPGYIWVNGEITKDDEVSVTEPEADDDDEDQTEDDPTDDFDGELGEAMRAAIWYDTGLNGIFSETEDPDTEDDDEGEGDNIKQMFDPETGEGERLIIRGSLNDVMAFFGEEVGFPLDGNPSNGLLGDGSEVPINGDETNGSSIGTVNGDAEASSLMACADVGGNPKCSDIRSDLRTATKQDVDDDAGDLVQSGHGPSGGDITTDAGKVTVESYDVDAGTVTLSTDFPVAAVITKGGPVARVCKADADEDDTPLEPGDGVILDNATFQTPLNPNSPDPDDRYGLSHFSVCVGITGGDGEFPPLETPVRDCFPASDTAYIGFAWWLPVDHANEIQTDSISFDLGFYAEQCRHNDGSGQPPEESA